MKTQYTNFRDTHQKKIFKLTKSLPQLEKNLYSLEEFKQRLAIEKRKSERLNYKLSIIFCDTNSFPNQNNKLPMEDITNTICHNIRAIDVVSLHKNKVILILLPDINNNGAECVSIRIVNTVIDSYASLQKLTHDDFQIKILTFPERNITETDLDEIIFDKRKSDDKYFSSAIHVPKELTFKRDYFKNLNLCLSTYNGSTISMPIVDTFFWDQQLVSKYLLFGKNISKRIMDIVGSIIGIISLLPVMLITALAVKITSPGPILFKQIRTGYKGNDFTFLKFRSMFVNNEDHAHRDYVTKLIQGEKDQINYGTSDNPCFKIKDDPRITPLGKFLRRTSLDELPQLFNVLKGEMSLVGPRPPILYEVKKYKNWHFRRILEVKPGITGLWQVSGRSRITFDEMVRLDIKYAKNWSLAMDLKILLKTIKVVFSAEGT